MKRVFIAWFFFVVIGCGSSQSPLIIGPSPMHPPSPQNEWTPDGTSSNEKKVGASPMGAPGGLPVSTPTGPVVPKLAPGVPSTYNSADSPDPTGSKPPAIVHDLSP